MASRYCVFCRTPLGDMRRDALYCSNNCRVRASYFRRKKQAQSDQPPTAPPIIERVRPARGDHALAPEPHTLAQSETPEPERVPQDAKRRVVRAFPVELVTAPNRFAEPYPALWFETAIAGQAPKEAAAYFLSWCDPAESGDLKYILGGVIVVRYRLHPFQMPPFYRAGTCVVGYVSATGEVLATPARLTLRLEERVLQE